MKRLWLFFQKHRHGLRLSRLSKSEQRSLKHRIRRRLATEDYTCRLPTSYKPKPRVRYKLTLRRHPFLRNTWVYS